MFLRQVLSLPGSLMDAYEDCALNGHNFVVIAEDDGSCYVECNICGAGEEF